MSYSYAGSKNSCYQQIINLIPPHETYIETHAGSAAIYRHKRPAVRSILIDIDPVAPVHTAAPIARCSGASVTVICADAIAYLDETPILPRTFIYIDPPYLMSTRRSKKSIYNHEYNEADHIEMLYTITSLTTRQPDINIMISGYYSQLYADALSGWHTHTFTAVTRGGTAVEWLWMNYEPPLRLHDYRYLGADYRERERIKRKTIRWVDGLARLPELERRAILSEIEHRYL